MTLSLSPLRGTAIGAALLVAAGSLTACGSSSGSTTIVLYSAQHAQTTDALVAAFEKQTGIHVVIEADDEDVLTAQIEQEGSRSPADVFYTENSNWLQQLADRGMLAKINKNTLANVPTVDSAANGDWVGVSARVATLVYNPSKISAAQLPKTVLDMASPEYKGKFEIAPSETDFWPVIASVDKAEGNAQTVSWLKALAANAGSSGDNVPDNETLTSDVSKGVTDFALINHYYYYRLQAEDPGGTGNAKLADLAPQSPGYVEGISGAAVLKSSKHQAEAQELVNFMTSEAGQKILESGQSFEYPLKAGVAANPELPPLSSYQPIDFTPADLGTGEIAKTLLQEAGLI